MQKTSRLAVGIVLSAAVLMGAYASAAIATTNYIPKYNSAGTLVDSTIIDVGGNVGIGVSSPSERLHVSARSLFGELMIGESQTGFSMVEDRGSNGLLLVGGGQASTGVFVRDDGRVGVGINPTTEKFVVRGGSDAGIVVTDASGAGRLRMGPSGAQHGEIHLWDNTNAKSLSLGGPSGGNNWMTGSLGIGTTTPSEKLSVVGNVAVTGNLTATGNLAAKYQDVAEWVDAPQPYPAGTVVVAGERSAVISSEVYDTSVIGVVSAQPGVLLGEAGPGRIAVAQSGRVRVKVDAGNGAIRVGDLLVTSATQGHAMRSTPLAVAGTQMHRPGTIIGKALENLPRGRGEILVLIALQ